ncbi:MAG TPA: hypothetical protein VGP36_04600 [Mycobacteriales bacterium]|nr:hypothetical protein [Mycobacteriales bacterium]
MAAGPVVTAGESSFAVRAFAINRFGYASAHLAWYDGGLGALQVAGYETISGALRRAPTAVAAAREATAVASVLAAIALTVAARRLKLSGPAVVAVPLLFGLAPAGLMLHRTADPTQLAVLWACVALALAGGESRRIGAAGSAAYLAAAVVTSPLVLVALVPLFSMLLWSGALARLPHRWRIVSAGAGVLVLAGLVALAVAGNLPGGGAAAIPDLGALDWVLAVGAIAAGLAGLRISWLRPLAVALLATAGTAAAAPDVRGSLILVALPLAALVLPAVAEAAVALAAGFVARRWAAFPARPVLVGVLAAAAIAAWIPVASDVREPVDGSRQSATTAARTWVLQNLPSRPKLVVDDAMWADLVDAGYPAEQLAAAGGVGPAAAAWPQGWRDARYAVGAEQVLRAAGAPVGDASRSSTPVASFGAITVRRVLSDPNATATAATETAGRIAAGGALALNPRLGLQPAAADLLRRGQVDARALSVLAAVTGEHALQIADFPAVPGENPAAPRRLIAVSAIDNRTVGPGSAAATMLDQWLQAQQPPFRPAGAELDQLGGTAVLVVRYDALGSTGLLPP